MFVIPVVVGLVVSAAVYLGLQQNAKPAQVKMATVVIAKKDLPVRTRLTAADLKTKQVPDQYVTPGALGDVNAAAGKITLVPLAQGEVILHSHLLFNDNKAALSYHIPKGLRAMTVQVDDVRSVAGFIQPGDHVDVLAYLPAGGSSSQKTAAQARIIAADVVVLAVDQDTSFRASGQKKIPATITLAVTDSGATEIELAKSVGDIQLILRPGSGDDSTSQPVFRLNNWSN